MGRSFNGTSDKIAADSAHLWTMGGNVTFFCWVFTTAANSNKEFYIEQNVSFAAFSTTTTAPFGIRFATNALPDDNWAGRAAINDGIWHPIGYVQNGTSGSYWMDGANVRTISRATDTSFTPNTATIGSATAGSNFFSGTISHMATWARTLSDPEMVSLARGVLPSAFSPDHYWPLYGKSSPEPDYGTAATVNGTLTGTLPFSEPPLTTVGTFIPSLGRRPVPMIKGPDTDRSAGMRGRFK